MIDKKYREAIKHISIEEIDKLTEGINTSILKIRISMEAKRWDEMVLRVNAYLKSVSEAKLQAVNTRFTNYQQQITS